MLATVHFVNPTAAPDLMSRFMPNAPTAAGSEAALRRKAAATRDYFDDDDDDDRLPVGPAVSADVDDELDPLDQFMAGVGSVVQSERQAAPVAANVLPEIVSGHERDYEGYYDMVDKQAKADAEAAEVEYDSDGIPVGLRGAASEGGKKIIDPLPPVDHSAISYAAFKKDLYREHPDTKALGEQEVADIRARHDIHVLGTHVPKPLQSFSQAGFTGLLLRDVARLGYERPTAIQMQALPIALSGRDMIGLAKTGSGKTLGFVWPLIMHVLDQPQMQLGDGPIGLILAPTRELVTQISMEASKFCKGFNIRVCAVYGGEGKWEQSRALKEAPEIVVATPGRFIDFASAKATNLRRCTMVVLDEADRMFEMGFEYQMRSIVNNIRPDRQTLLFSATMKKKIEGFAREILKDPVRIVIGAIGSSNKDIHQVVDVISSASGKWSWLTRRIDDWVAEGKVLIFVGSRVDTDTLAENLKKFFLHRQLAVGLDSLHGDKTQADRSNILRKFRSGEVSVLIATDVASRGLDIKDIRTVVNYDCAKNIDTHVHRIGRTGRMGVDGVTPGTAYTVLVSEKIPSADSSLAVDLVKNLREAEQENQISADLLKLAQSDPRSFALNSRSSGGSNSRSSGDRAGIGSSGAALAMTSAMMAAASTGKQPAAGNASSSKYYVANNKCIVGQSMDRRKNSSESSWTADGRNDLVEGPEQKELKLNTASNAQKNGGLPPSFSTPALAGFVRATSTLASVHANMSSPVEATNTVKSHVDLVRTKKRSRWDS